MKGIRTATRSEWVRKVLGPKRKFTLRQMERVLHLRWFEGWITAMPAEGPALERLAIVHQGVPMAELVRAYQAGERWFARAEVEAILQTQVDTRLGAQRLGKAGFAIVGCENGRLEVRAVDPRTASLVNESRCRASNKGYSVRRVIEAVLHVRDPRRRRINITDDRRLMAAEVLLSSWSIECEDLLVGRLRVRLISKWTFPAKTAHVAPSPVAVGG